MILAALQGVVKHYGVRPVLTGLDLAIEDGARIGLVGPNGGGKSTLLRILAGLETADGGEVVRQKDLRMALLPQHVPDDERTPLQVALGAREDLQQLETELLDCEVAMSTPEVYGDMKLMERKLARQERLLRQFELLGGPGFEGEARSILLGLGLREEDLARSMSLLSGGQRKLAVLASCLAQRPDLLLLDEPETHLDLGHRERLEELIRSFSGAIVVVSHDRYLLDETVSDIAELNDGTIRMWPGNYSAYALARELALQRQQQLYQSQQHEIERLEEAIIRFKHWAEITVNERHIKQARVKQRQIDQMEKVDRPVLERRKLGLRLRSEARGGQKVFELRSVNKAFDGDAVLTNLDVTVRRGERVGIVGPNGSGKTVLAKLLMRQMEPSAGVIWQGPSIRTGYFAQDQETLPDGQTPVELLRRSKPLSEGEAVSLLLQFLFNYEQMRQQVRTMSGGERSRLQLLLVMLGGANCLILDEPTNDLDIDSAEVLEGALERFDGTVIIISHDRYFLDRITDRTIEITDGSLTSYEGGYSAFMHAKRTQLEVSGIA